ncbi:hypothetical protein KCU99_g300, partial [Aureobasidium melanogenum]
MVCISSNSVAYVLNDIVCHATVFFEQYGEVSTTEFDGCRCRQPYRVNRLCLPTASLPSRRKSTTTRDNRSPLPCAFFAPEILADCIGLLSCLQENAAASLQSACRSLCSRFVTW